MNEKGYIKYICHWVKSDPINTSLIDELNFWRSQLFDLQFIGVYSNGIGYGNISVRLKNNEFLISGTSTGHYPNLTSEHFTRVVTYNFAENSLTCEGPIQASSESLTHAAIYESDSDIHAVIHVHNLNLWKTLLNRVPTSLPEIEYGTPEMAYEIQRLFKETNLKNEKILAMGGHEEGLISIGQDLGEAGRILMAKVH